MAKIIGILTSGGDTPGLNAAIRAVGKTALGDYNMRVIGFRDGFRGLMENRTVRLDSAALSGILTVGGTVLGTSRDKPHKMPIGGKTMDIEFAEMGAEKIRAFGKDASIVYDLKNVLSPQEADLRL